MAKRPIDPISQTPVWETRARKPLPGGRVPSITGGMWLYRLVPMSNVTEARSVADAVAGGHTIQRVLSDLADLARGRGANRRVMRSQYREVHFLLINIPTWFRAQPDSPIGDYLNRQYASQVVIKRMLVMGVRLNANAKVGDWRSFIDSFTETMVHGGTPVSDFDDDYAQVDPILARAGLTVPTADEFNWLNAWWNHGGSAATPTVTHDEHLHMFRTLHTAKDTERYGLEDCSVWPENPEQAAVTFASVQNFTYGFENVETAFSRWVPPLLDAGARAISVRGFIEPARVTRQELKAQARRYRNDIREAADKGKMDRAEHEQRLGDLTALEQSYARDEAPPTLVDTSVLVALDGVWDDLSVASTSALALDPMTNRQPQAWHESMLCSNIRANPHIHDLPTTAIAYSGIASLTEVGDTDGALLGFTERDRQPVYISPTAASAGDAAPTMAVFAGTGSGKLLPLDTPIPTPAGWTTMGDLVVGDEVLDRHGNPARVTFLSHIDPRPGLNQITLGDRRTIDADNNHQWVVQDREFAVASDANRTLTVQTLRDWAASFQPRDALTPEHLFQVLEGANCLQWPSIRVMRAALDFLDIRLDDNGEYPAALALAGLAARLEFIHTEEAKLEPGERICTTAELADLGLCTRDGRRRFAIRHSRALNLPDTDLADPYTLGVWLTGGEEPGVEALASVLSSLESLALQGLIAADRIPLAYLRAGHQQRLELLQGIVDTSGEVFADGSVVVELATEALTTDVAELVRSLGIQVTVNTVEGDRPTLISFTTDLHVSRAKFRVVQLPDESDHEWVSLVSILPISSRPGRCIQVDSPDATYLAGDFIPTHNTMLLQWLSHQFALLGRPTVIIDPKTDSDLAPTVELSGGHVYSLDDFVNADGPLDPLRVTQNLDTGVQMASSMLSTVNPWGALATRMQYETDVANAIRYGVDRGARATGQALNIALADGVIAREIVEPIFKMAGSYPMFRATFGINPDTPALSVADGITLFKVGKANFKRPSLSDKRNMAEAEPLVRTSVNVIRMMVTGSMMALTGRGGVLNIDEEWIVEAAAPDALEEIGRLARSQNVLPILYTQTPSGPLGLGLKGYMSRGLIGHISDEEEAGAGLDMFKALSSPLLERVTADAFESGAANFHSLKAIRDPETNGVLRGAVFYHSDLRKRLAPVEVVIPAEFFRLASTTPEEVARRHAQRAASAQPIV